MSLSKLESLPNEILLNLVETYINGVDIIIAFNHQLNQRFDQIIAQSRRIRLDFTGCRIDDFRLCMGLLPAYIHKIEELTISDRDTPVQVNAFLSFHPGFLRFTQLRKIYIRVSPKTIDWYWFRRAIDFLKYRPLEILSIEAEEEGLPDDFAWQGIIWPLQRASKLKRLCLLNESRSISWKGMGGISSRLEYFVAPYVQCELHDLNYLLEQTPCLKHLHISITDSHTWNQYYRSTRPLTLRTVILTCTDLSISLNTLAPYFAAMPLLDHLDMMVSTRLLQANDWELLITTSLPALKYFVLRTTETHLNEAGIENVRASFQNAFWLSKTQFRLIITKDSDRDLNRSKKYFSSRYRHTFRQSPFPYLIIPDRRMDNDTTIVDETMSTLFSDRIDTLSNQHYFNNVKYLCISNFEQSTLDWIKTYVNCPRILELALTIPSDYLDDLATLLILTRNKISLFTDLQTIRTYYEIFKNEDNCLKRLDLSSNEHGFEENDIRTIAELFPHLEHLVINTADLKNIPLLKIYLPNLISLTYSLIHDKSFAKHHFCIMKLNSEHFRQSTDFFFAYRDDQVTIWMNHQVCEHHYWKRFDTNLRPSTTNSTGQTRTIIQKLFSLLKIRRK